MQIPADLIELLFALLICAALAIGAGSVIVELWRRNRNIIHTEMVQYCAISGDPGCLGWHLLDCVYVEQERQFCSCGGNDVYGEMWHEYDCNHYRPLTDSGFCDTMETE